MGWQELVKFNKERCKVLCARTRLGTAVWKAALQERNWGSWWALTTQKKASSLSHGIRKNMASRSREVVLPLSLALLRHSWSAEFNSGVPNTRRM